MNTACKSPRRGARIADARETGGRRLVGGSARGCGGGQTGSRHDQRTPGFGGAEGEDVIEGDKWHLELTLRNLKTRHASIAPHLHHAVTVIEDGGQARPFGRLDLAQPFALDHDVVAVVAGLAHAEALGSAERPRPQHIRWKAEAPVALKPLDRLRLALVAATGPDPHLGAGLAQGLQRADDGQVRRVVTDGSKEAAPVLLSALDEVQPVLNQRQRAIKVEK